MDKREKHYFKLKRILGCSECPHPCRWPDYRVYNDIDIKPNCDRKGADFLVEKILVSLKQYPRWLASKEGELERSYIISNLKSSIIESMTRFLFTSIPGVELRRLRERITVMFDFDFINSDIKKEDKGQDDRAN